MFGWFKRKPKPEPEDMLEAPDGFQQGVEAFAWRVLVNAHMRVIARAQGRDPLRIQLWEQRGLLEPYRVDIERDAKALGLAIAQARSEGIASLHGALHRAPGLDHEMVDQALLFAYEQTKGRKQR